MHAPASKSTVAHRAERTISIHPFTASSAPPGTAVFPYAPQAMPPSGPRGVGEVYRREG
jgi:hypothetical protein